MNTKAPQSLAEPLPSAFVGSAWSASDLFDFFGSIRGGGNLDSDSNPQGELAWTPVIGNVPVWANSGVILNRL